MNKIWPIAKKEIYSYFQSPIAYVVLFVTLSIFNVFFFMIIDENREATLRDVFKVMEFMFVFIVPLLTMKTFAEEKQMGTMEFLMTAPVSNSAIVTGKYLGSLAFFSLIMALTLVYYAIVEAFSDPDRLATLAGYGGIWMEGALFTAVGLMVSSWTRNQITAAISSYVLIFALYFSISFVEYTTGALQSVVRYTGSWSHAENLAAGLINSHDIVYFLSGIVFCLMMTRLSVENRLWR